MSRHHDSSAFDTLRSALNRRQAGRVLDARQSALLRIQRAGLTYYVDRRDGQWLAFARNGHGGTVFARPVRHGLVSLWAHEDGADVAHDPPASVRDVLRDLGGEQR